MGSWMQARREKKPRKIGRGRAYNRPVVILKRDVFTGEYAPGINPALINSFPSG